MNICKFKTVNKFHGELSVKIKSKNYCFNRDQIMDVGNTSQFSLDDICDEIQRHLPSLDVIIIKLNVDGIRFKTKKKY